MSNNSDLESIFVSRACYQRLMLSCDSLIRHSNIYLISYLESFDLSVFQYFMSSRTPGVRISVGLISEMHRESERQGRESEGAERGLP